MDLEDLLRTLTNAFSRRTCASVEVKANRTSWALQNDPQDKASLKKALRP
jgi:hypothetical protein